MNQYICKLCDKPFNPKTNKVAPTFCSHRCSRKADSIRGAYIGGRLALINEPKGIVLKVLRHYEIPTSGVNFDEGRNSFMPKFTSKKVNY